MKDNSFDKNPEDVINNNPEVQEKEILINSQGELVKHLKNAHDHEGVYVGVEFGIGKYLIYNENNNGTITGVKLFDMLCDGVIAPNAITNLDEILKYKDVIKDFKNLRNFLYKFYDCDFGQNNIPMYVYVFKGGKIVELSQSELENVASAFNAEQLKQNPTKYVINLAKQKDSLKKEDYTPEDPLENYLLKESIVDISDLQNLLDEGQQILWNKLAPALEYRSIKELNTLNKVAAFNENNKINANQTFLFDNKSVGNWQELFEICDDGAKNDFIVYDSDFMVFKDGVWKGFDLNDKQTLKEYGLIKKSRFRYLLYVLWDIGRIIVWAVSCGNWCKYKYKYDPWFEKTVKVYKKNCNIEDATKRIKENQKKEPVPEQPKEIEKENEEDKNNNIDLTDRPKPKKYDNKSQGQDISVEDMK